MIKCDVAFLSVDKIRSVAGTLFIQLIESSNKPSKHISYQIQLLEVLAYEIRRLDKLGYCDFELAFLCYELTQKLLAECKNHESLEIKDLISTIDSTLEKKRERIQTIQDCISKNSDDTKTTGVTDDTDPLLSRFNKLSLKSKSPEKTIPASNSIDTYKYTEVITAPELHQLIESKVSVLLIDFRTKTEYNYNHINHPDVINIEPSLVNSLLGPENKNNSDSITDQDLEERLRLLLPDDQYARFSNRHKYELVVMYNLRYGVSQKQVDRFDALAVSLINNEASGNPSKAPFGKLVDILAYRNKYISSKLKRAPCYLSGGVSFWYSLYGESSISKTINNDVFALPQASRSRDGLQSPSGIRRNSYMQSSSTTSLESITSATKDSPYLKNFGDYLGTAKTTKSTPKSNNFIKSGFDMHMDSSYTPSSPLQPNTSNFGALNGAGPATASTSTSTIHRDSSPSFTPPQQQMVRKPSLTSKLSSSFTAPSSSPQMASSQSSSSTSKDPTKFLEQYVTGLTNLGNSCYMNCILQCLGATPQLTKFFIPSFPSSSSSEVTQTWKQHINPKNNLGTKGILTSNFVQLLLSMFTKNGSYFTPSDFKRVAGSLSPGKQFLNTEQQDCIEFLNFLLDTLHEDLNQMGVSTAQEKQAIMELTPEQERTREFLPVRLASTIEWERYLKLNFSVIVDYFQGQLLSQLKCLECGLTSTTYNAFSILSLPIPEKLNKTSNITLEDCLQEFVQLELLDDQNKWHCPKCKRFTKSTKKITITRLPQVLIIHFKRFSLSPTGYFSKLDTFIKYPVNGVLDLTSYWPAVGTSVNPNIDPSEVMSKDKEAQILATLPTRNQVPPFRYKLYAVANHYGNLTTGHYTAFVHKKSDAKKKREWCYFDDSKVSYNQSESQVMNKNAYCLFYQRV